jgi:hypothetical protein
MPHPRITVAVSELIVQFRGATRGHSNTQQPPQGLYVHLISASGEKRRHAGPLVAALGPAMAKCTISSYERDLTAMSRLRACANVQQVSPCGL